MNYMQEFEKRLAYSRTRESAGYYPCKIRPVSPRGKQILAAMIEAKIEKQPTYFTRLLEHFDAMKLKTILTEENYAAIGLDFNFEVSAYEAIPSNIVIAKGRALQNAVESMHNILRSDVEAQFGKFVAYPPEKHLDYDDIPDLRNQSRGGE
ncbi:hypothetical protein ACIQYS_14465 [Psychrobacillus sp. NPDC096426]|uniref:hypothetical protein n=1 Tax=Psychrobacillus sp. NPDC096426 TaxID=3364491 RepID=UPI0038208F16